MTQKRALPSWFCDTAALRRTARGFASADSPRDRLIELTLVWLEGLAPHKKEAARLFDALHAPKPLGAALPELAAHAALLLDLAGYETGGTHGAGRVFCFLAVLGITLPTWLRDDDPALSASMATLDRTLARMEKLAAHL